MKKLTLSSKNVAIFILLNVCCGLIPRGAGICCAFNGFIYYGFPFPFWGLSHLTDSITDAQVTGRSMLDLWNSGWEFTWVQPPHGDIEIGSFLAILGNQLSYVLIITTSVFFLRVILGKK